MQFDPNAPSSAGSGIFGLDHAIEDADVVLIPVPFEATTSYGSGAANGPAAILVASHQVDLFDVETGRPYAAGITMLPRDGVVEQLNIEAKASAERVIAGIGDVEGERRLVNVACRAVERSVYEAARAHIEAGKIVGVVGGDHSVPLGSIRAHGEAYGEFGILHIDAHADLREAYQGFEQSHASIMNNVLADVPEVTRLVQVGVRDFCEAEHAVIEADDRIVTWFDATIARRRVQGGLLEWMAEAVDDLPEQVYVSFDIDGLDPKLCPNTGTPVPGGLDANEASMLLEAVAASRTIIGFDLCEVAPGDDDRDEWDGNVGARMLYKLIGWTLRSRDR